MTQLWKIKLKVLLAFIVCIFLFVSFVGYVEMGDFEDYGWNPRFFIKTTPSWQMEFYSPLIGEEKDRSLATMDKERWADNLNFCKQRFGLHVMSKLDMQHCINLQEQDLALYWNGKSH